MVTVRAQGEIIVVHKLFWPDCFFTARVGTDERNVLLAMDKHLFFYDQIVKFLTGLRIMESQLYQENLVKCASTAIGWTTWIDFG